MPTKKPRNVAAMQPITEIKSVLARPTKYTAKCESVATNLKNGLNDISNPAGSSKKPKPVAIFLFSRL